MPAPIMARPDFLRAPNRQGAIPSNISDAEQGYTRSVDPNELTSTHLNSLTAGNSRYIRNARGSGAALANSRGLGNSSLAAANSEAAAIGAAAPIASEDAGAYRTAASENLQSLANQRLGNEQNATSIFNQIHGDTTQSGIAQNRLDFERDQDQYRHGWDIENRDTQRGWQVGDRQQERDWSREDEDRNYRRGVETGVTGRVLEQAMNDPTLARNPQAMFGLIETWQTELRRILNLPGGP